MVLAGLLLVFVSLLLYLGFVYASYHSPVPPPWGDLGPIIGFVGFIVAFAGLMGNPKGEAPSS